MNQGNLHDLLTLLHERLGKTPSVDAEDRRLLVTVLADIENALGQNQATPRPDTAGLESLAAKFEAEHPALSETLRRLVDTLAKAGI